MRRGQTLIELVVVLAIAATVFGLLVAAFRRQHVAPGEAPPTTIQMVTVQHDGHWWVLCRDTFAHHPDCPCRGRTAEAQ